MNVTLVSLPVEATVKAPVVAGLCVQPRFGSQASLEHGLPSSQLGFVPPLHTPTAHASLRVHGLLSSQAAPSALVWAQPPPMEQVSLVQGFPSSHVGPLAPMQLPPKQVSPLVQALPSSQAAPGL